MANEFFLIFLATILAVRFLLFIEPLESPSIRNVHLHHYMYGFAITVSSFALSSLVLYAIGLGLIADELPILFSSRKTDWNSYNATIFRVSTLALVVLVYFSKQWIILPFIPK